MVAQEFFPDFKAIDFASHATIARMAGRPPKPIVNPPNRIREVREAKGMTQEQVGHRIGKTGPTVAKYETGEAAVSVYQLGRIARALNVPAYTLLSDYDAPQGEIEAAAIAILRRLGPDDRQRAVMLLAALEQSDARRRNTR